MNLMRRKKGFINFCQQERSNRNAHGRKRRGAKEGKKGAMELCRALSFSSQCVLRVVYMVSGS